MIVLGFAGGSGVGKTTIARSLAKRFSVWKVGHVDADAVAHDLLNGDVDIRRRVLERFGRSILTGEKIDRKKLGAVVFGREEALRDLNAIIHPAVVAACRQRVAELEEGGAKLVIVDAALLLEVPDAPAAMGIDYVMALRAPREERLRRLLDKGDAAREEIETRLDNQEHMEKSFYRADVVVDTNRPLSAVVDEIAAVIKKFVNGDTGDEPRR